MAFFYLKHLYLRPKVRSMKNLLTIKSILILIFFNILVSLLVSVFYVSYTIASTSELKNGYNTDDSTIINTVKSHGIISDSPVSSLGNKKLQDVKSEHIINTSKLSDYFFAAARTGNVEVLNYFIEEGFPVDHRNAQSYTALWSGQVILATSL